MNKLVKKPISQQNEGHPNYSKPSFQSKTATSSGILTMRSKNTMSTTTADVDVNVSVQPLTASEQYWATRALKAEALLAAQESHYRELKSVSYSQEIKRSREIAQLTQHHKDKHATLEKILITLASCLVLFVVLIIYLSTNYTRAHTQQHNRWVPSHFTIPILSPFTSVVEQDTSVIGTKSIAFMVLAFACLVYFIFRHWYSHRRHPT